MDDGTDPDAPRETAEAEPRVSNDRGSDDRDGFVSSDAPPATDETNGAPERASGTRATRPLLDLDPTDPADATPSDPADASEGPWIDRSATADDQGPDAGRPPTHDRDRGRGRTTDGRSSDGRSDGDSAEVTELRTNGSETDRGTISRLARALGTDRRVGFANAYDVDEHGPLATFETTEVTERDRYWVNHPYALVVVTTDPATSDLQYHVVEPDLDPVEKALLSALEDDVRDALLYRQDLAESPGEPIDPDALIRRELDRRLTEYDVPIDARRFEALFYYLHRSFRGYGRIDPLMHDPGVEDISCDGYDLPIFVYHDSYGNVETTVSFGEDRLDDFVVRLAQRSGRHVSLGRPVVEATLPDGSRAELALGTEVTPRGSAFTIRRYAEDPFTPLDLIANGTFSTEQAAYLWLCIEHGRNLLFAGGTASGKTTAMNAVSMFMPPRAKVLTIEDTRELTLFHDNWLSSITRERSGGDTDVTMYDLLRSALRHRPEYIVVGEVRGKEAMTLFQAMNTGHTTYSTMHADSVRTVINRLENEPINVPRQMVQSLDVLCVQGFASVDGERVRRTRQIAEIDGIDERTGELDYSTAFEWRPEDDSHSDRGSKVTEAIREGQGWSRTDLLRELKRRRTFLETLRENGVDDYRRFTAAVKAYYADPERAMAGIETAARPGASTTDSDTTGNEEATDRPTDDEPGS